ncbi:MAG: hypothetical protein FJ139_09680 [Deltaproteobacteria bacterium]|nr:hypothetical protein [Deltaproteobacteria bacterium]
MNGIKEPPGFLFHTKFFPALLWRLIRPEKREYESTFAGHIALEYVVLTVISIAVSVFGFAAALGTGSIIFLFFVFIGITTGLAIATGYHFGYGLKVAAGVAGLFSGYVTGIYAGLWVQYLGWMAALLDIIALAAIAGMIILDIIMLL